MAVLFKAVKAYVYILLAVILQGIALTAYAQVMPLSDSIIPPLDTIAVPAQPNTGKIKFDAPGNDSSIVQFNSIFERKGDSAAVAQKKEKLKKHSPLKAALFSALLPGLGQAYNKRYWKIPIVYAGLGGLGYAVYYTADNFTKSRNAYRLSVDLDSTTIGIYRGSSSASELKEYRDYYKRFLDLSILFTSLWYTLNIIDAAVDAHLFYWNVNDDLTLNWEPQIRPTYANGFAQTSVGIRLRLGF